jgi:hypothetical protein
MVMDLDRIRLRSTRPARDNMEDVGEVESWWEEHGRAHTQEEMEGFRLWFEFLKLSDRQKWSVSVVEHFGDLPDSFELWWPNHAYLFRTFKLPVLEEIESVTQYQAVAEAHPTPGDPGMLALAVSMYATKRELRATFEELLSKYHRGHAGRPEFETFGDHFQFASRPDITMLEKVIAVYKVYAEDQKKPEKERMKLWEIEEVVSEDTPLIVKTGQAAEYIWKEKHVDASIVESRRRSQHTTVRKYLNYAEEILENVVVGTFPVYTVGKSKANTPPEAADR